MRTVLVLDFDNTLTERDVGDALCDRLAPPAWREWDDRWCRGEISLPEAQRHMWGLARATRDEAVAAALAVTRLREGLDGLLDAAEARGIEVWIASGGFDFYIDAFLGDRRRRFARIDCNSMQWVGHRMTPVFNRPELSCGRCAVCKGKVCDLAAATGARVMFAGDGHSDACVLGPPARAQRIAALRGSALERIAGERGVKVGAFDDLDELAAIFGL